MSETSALIASHKSTHHGNLNLYHADCPLCQAEGSEPAPLDRPTKAATPEVSHAEQNARGWLSTIREFHAALSADRERLEELRDARDTWESEDGKEFLSGWAKVNPDDAEELAELESAVAIDGEELDEEAIRERIQESPLSVEVRDGWKSPGAESDGPEEYCILLSTGGPALRIVGDLDQHCQPTSARLEHQDWFTPWTELVCTGDDHEALMSFVGAFYFGG